MEIIDLRSDTVTKPTAQMHQAMFAADVGDDVFGEDPTVKALEEYAAGMFGKEAGLFCPSGTMTNQLAIKLHTQPGQEVICDQKAHIYLYEGGGIAFNSSCSVRLLAGERGCFTAEQLEAAINPDDVHFPPTALVALENSMNKGGGSIYPLEEIRKIRELCNAHALPMHLDGARLCNALVASGQAPEEHGQLFDTISLCLSKGLGAPVGSVLLGSEAHIRKARRFRKVFGGGMRQAGYLAAAGLYALQHHVARLAEDNDRAQRIGQFVEGLSFIDEVLPVETNIVLFKLNKRIQPAQFLNWMQEQGVKAVGFGGQYIRMVTHMQFTEVMMDRLKEVLMQYEEKNKREGQVV